jgi:hypothetical protein
MDWIERQTEEMVRAGDQALYRIERQMWLERAMSEASRANELKKRVEKASGRSGSQNDGFQRRRSDSKTRLHGRYQVEREVLASRK